jgi:hypothetical protein
MQRLIAPLAVMAAATLISAPAAAQDAPGDKVNTVIIYGADACPKSTGNEITVCARLDESERYRIPENLRDSDSPANQSWAAKVRSFETVGDFGPLSCTPFGAGGELGCTAKEIEAAYAERKGGPSVRFSQLIAEARGQRLAGIDAEAAETQGRVEQAEKEYLARVGQAQDAADGSATPSTQPSEPRLVDPNKLARPPSQ